jgi:Spy/CpxP family protein refolding chaperone
MKKCGWLLCAAAALMLATTACLSAEEATEKAPAETKQAPSTAKEKPAVKENALRGEYAIMAAQCNLTDEQQNALKTKIAARHAAMEAWIKANGSKLETLQEAVKNPKDPNDKEAINRMAEELKAIEADRVRIQATFDADLQAILTPDQQLRWTSFRLNRLEMGRYRKISLTVEQIKKIKEAADAAAKETLDVKGDEKAAKAGRAEVELKLRKTIEETILTPEQREMLPKPILKAAPGAEEKKPPEEKK